MLISLLFLIVLAVTAYQSQWIIVPAIVFGALKALSSCFFYMAETEMTHSESIMLAGSQFSINAVLAVGIAYLVVKRSQDWKYMFVTTILAVLTYLTTFFESWVVS